MSFLDDQATGQIGIGEKASLSTLTRRKRKRKRGQAPTGAETYSLLPQNEFSNLVSSPTDITQVGIGEKLQAQGTAAGDVPNVFKEYDSAAPKGTTLESIYYQPPPDDDDDDDDDLPSVEDDPYVPDADPGIGEGDPLSYGDPYNIPEDSLLGELLTFLDGPTKAAATRANRVVDRLEGVYQKGINALTGAQSASEAGYEFSTTTSTGQTVPTTESSGRPVTVGAMQGTPFGSTPDADAGGEGGGNGPGGNDGGGGGGSGFDPTGGIDPSMLASGGTVTKSKSKNKNSFMSMKGK